MIFKDILYFNSEMESGLLELKFKVSLSDGLDYSIRKIFFLGINDGYGFSRISQKVFLERFALCPKGIILKHLLNVK